MKEGGCVACSTTVHQCMRHRFNIFYFLFLDGETSQPDSALNKTPKRKKKKKSTPLFQARNANKRLRGESYVGFKKADGVNRETLEKPARSMGPRCSGHCKNKENPKPQSGPNQNFQCGDVTDAQREIIFNYFWQLDSWGAKKTFIRECVILKRPEHRRNNMTQETSRKALSMIFYLPLRDEETKLTTRLRVCRQFLLETLSLGEKTVRNWVLQDSESNELPEEGENSLENLATTCDSIQMFFDRLPKMESHYCRASSSKIYLEPVFTSQQELYNLYKADCGTEKPASKTQFRRYVKQNKIAIFSPKKDQCNSCTEFKVGSSTPEEYSNHLTKKEQANVEKTRDKQLALEDETVKVVTVDLQAVLLAPRLNTAANYYKTKLKVHNQVYFDLATKDVQCYVWHEGQGGLESDVFASISKKYISDLKEKNEKMENLIIWSDGCCYQNRNSKLATCLLDLAKELNINIFQKYLTVGHTHMEVDSVHSTIERKLKNRREIYVPAGYLDVIQTARVSSPGPYNVSYLHYNDFDQYEASINIRPGTKKGDPVVTDVVAYQFAPTERLSYKLHFPDDWKELQFRRKVSRGKCVEKLYGGPLPIEKSKYLHLQELKQFIPEDYREFYTSLLHK